MASRLPAGVDFSQLTQPIDLGTPAVLQIAKCLSSGSDEIRELLLYECDTIFECRICRSLFRGLPNFLSHKRVYCMKKFKDKNLEFLGNNTESSVLIVHPEDPDAEVQEVCKEREESQLAVEKSLMKSFSRSQPLSKASTSSTLRGPNKDEPLVQLTLSSIPGTNNAVYQQVNHLDSTGTIVINDDKRNDASNSKTDPPIPNNKNVSILKTPVNASPAEQTSTNSGHSIRVQSLAKCDYIDLKNLTCTQCDHKYSSFKSLYQHTRTQHSKSRTFYPCLFCKSVFTAVWGVTRHMERIHEKSKQQADKLKDKIRSKSFQRRVKPLAKITRRPTLEESQQINKQPVKQDTPQTVTEQELSSAPPIVVEQKEQKVKEPLGMKLPLCNVELSNSIVDSSVPSSSAVSVEPILDRVVHIVPVTNTVNKSPPPISVTRPSDQALDIPASKKAKLSSVIDSLIKNTPSKSPAVSPKRIIKPEHVGENEIMPVPKSARQKFLEDQRKEQEKYIFASNGNDVSMLKCEICQKAFFKQDSYLRHVSYCVFDEDRIEAETLSSRSREICGKSKQNSLCKGGPLKISSGKPNQDYRKRPRSNESMAKQEAANRVEDRKTRSKTGSSTPKAMDNAYVNSGEKSPLKKEKINNTAQEEDEDRLYHYLDLEEEELRLVKEIIDIDNMKCKKCLQVYSTISSLHRHAVRHFGWKRFKCTLCSYLAFHRSECYSHLRRTHLAQLTADKQQPSHYVERLSPDFEQDTTNKGSRVDKNNSPPSLNLVDLSIDSVRRRPPRLSPQKVTLETSTLTEGGESERKFTKINTRKSSSDTDVSSSGTAVKCNKGKQQGKLQQNINQCNEQSTSKRKSLPVKAEKIAVIEEKPKRSDSSRSLLRSNTHEGIILRNKPIVIKSANSKEQTLINSSPNKVIVTPMHKTRPTILRRAPARSNQSILFDVGNKRSAKIVVNKTQASPTTTTSVSIRGNSRLRASTASGSIGMQTLPKVKLVNNKGGKTTDVFLLVVDEKKSHGPSSTAAGTTVKQTVSGNNQVIVVQSTGHQSTRCVDTKNTPRIVTVPVTHKK